MLDKPPVFGLLALGLRVSECLGQCAQNPKALDPKPRERALQGSCKRVATRGCQSHLVRVTAIIEKSLARTDLRARIAVEVEPKSYKPLEAPNPLNHKPLNPQTLRSLISSYQLQELS